MPAALMRARVAPLQVAKPKTPAKPAQHTSATAIPNLSGAPAMPTGLQYSSDDSPGIRRLRRGKGFSYCDDNGQTVSSRAERKRLTNLAIPPAYRDVWICPSPQGHLQATGRDARGRKQYLYHPDWRVARDETKFDRMAAFGLVLPRVRATVTRDLAQPAATTVSQTAVTAALVRLLDTTMVRVGNDEYARSNKSYGLTTLRKRHVALDGDKLRLKFRGKSGVEHEVALKDKRVARSVQRCQGKSCSSTSTMLGSCTVSGLPRSTTTCARPAVATSQQRTFAPGTAALRHWRCSCNWTKRRRKPSLPPSPTG